MNDFWRDDDLLILTYEDYFHVFWLQQRVTWIVILSNLLVLCALNLTWRLDHNDVHDGDDYGDDALLDFLNGRSYYFVKKILKLQ